jgi:hypothetical protein
MNNAPVGLIVNLVIWNKADIKKILIGGSLIFASLALEYVNKRNTYKNS